MGLSSIGLSNVLLGAIAVTNLIILLVLYRRNK